MMSDAFISQLLAERFMGHGQRAEDQNLGLGNLYYALTRMYRPRRAVVIGSWRGFAPIIIAKAMSENLEGGEVTFIDPSLADDFWADPVAVAAHFARFGVERHIKHHKLTTQEFIQTAAHEALSDIDLLFIDGLHTMEQAAFDHNAFALKMRPSAPVLFHDSNAIGTSGLYVSGLKYSYSVFRYIELLRQMPHYQVTDFPFGRGLAMVVTR